jgi:hypothetical protein
MRMPDSKAVGLQYAVLRYLLPRLLATIPTLRRKGQQPKVMGFQKVVADDALPPDLRLDAEVIGGRWNPLPPASRVLGG